VFRSCPRCGRPGARGAGRRRRPLSIEISRSGLDDEASRRPTGVSADFDKRIGDQKEWPRFYSRWSAAVASRQRAVAHSVLFGVLVILLIGLVGLFFDTWLERLIRKVRSKETG